MSPRINSISNNTISDYSISKSIANQTSIINSEIEFDTCNIHGNSLEGFNTGFGENNDLYFETKCKKPKLNTPLYQENYLSEFRTEEERAAARHALGLYNKGDVVAMSMLTAEDSPPSKQDWSEFTVKQLKKGDKFFVPFTSFNAVFDSSGVNLNVRMNEINSLIVNQQKEISRIVTPTKDKTITSLGDMKLFLQGFTNGDNLHNTITEMNKNMLRFEKTGDIL